jgi:hypothetical protein
MNVVEKYNFVRIPLTIIYVFGCMYCLSQF